MAFASIRSAERLSVLEYGAGCADDDDLKIADPATGVIKYRISNRGVEDLVVKHTHVYAPNLKLPWFLRLWLNDICICCVKTRLKIAQGS